MPPSPARRYSAGRELRLEGHKRGRSLEGGLVFREKDDDLVLFKEIQVRERDNFLLQSDDNFEESFSTKLRHFSDFKLGIAIPGKGKSSDLLNVEGEKNDYDWLLTPPDTPLFRSLDDEAPPATVPRRGRPRSQPISISRSSTMDKSYRSSRGSASPSRSSQSPRSSSSVSQSRGRPSSAHQASPTPSRQHSMLPNRGSPPYRASPPPSKSTNTGPRSSTPTSRRMSGSSGAAVGSSVRGISPGKISRGNSASPKIRAWQANIPGFSTEAPPNLRTSLTDRPASYVRGTSPASRNSQDSSSHAGRHSLSPTGTRSSISYSQDRDQFNSLSKGSVGSSGDDDVDSLQSAYVGSLDRLNLKKVGASPSKKPFSSSKKRVVSSAPKKSFDSVLRQMDPRKAPQNMFRPLLSSVPSSTFHTGNSISMQRSLVSRNSSVTTSSHTSADHGIGMALDMDGSDEPHDGTARESAEGMYSGVEPEIFEFDEAESANEDLESESHQENQLVNIQLDEFSKEPVFGMLDNSSGDAKGHVHSSMLAEMTATSEASHGSVDLHRINNTENLVACSVCGYEYDASGYSEGDGEVCPECRRKWKNLDNAVSGLEPILTEFIEGQSVDISEENVCLVKSNFSTASFESQRSTHIDERSVLEESSEQRIDFSSHNRMMDAGKNELTKEEGIPPAAAGSDLPDANSKNQTLLQLNNLSKGDASEATGISLLLARSSSIKGPVIQGRTFTVSAAIPRDDLSYARDSTSSMRSSYGRGSVSRSSSIDYGSRQIDHLAHSHLHSLKLTIDGQKYDIRSQSMDSSFSGTSENAQQGLGIFPTVHGDFENTIANDEDNTMVGTVQSLELVHQSNSSLSNKVLSTSVNLDNEPRIGSEDDDAARDRLGTSDIHEDAISQGEVRSLMKRGSDTPGCSGVPAVSSANMSETEARNREFSTVSDDDASPNHIALNMSSGPFDGQKSAAIPELSTSGPPHDIREESTIMVEARAGSKARSLTLEEATDTILFCSSIVHDLTYKAATIAIEKEDVVPLEGSHPTVTVLGKSAADVKDPPRRGRIVGKRALKSQKARPWPVETEKRFPISVAENDENVAGSLSGNIGLLPSKVDTEKPLKLESKCNCTIM